MKGYLSATIAVISGITGYLVYTRSDALSAIIAVLTVAWLGYRFSDGQRAWDTFSIFKNPFMMGIICFLVGFSYYAYRGSEFLTSASFGLGTGILGITLGAMLYKYWNMG